MEEQKAKGFIKKNFGFIKAVAFFSILIFVLYLTTLQLGSSFTKEVNENGKNIKENRGLQLEARDIQNGYRNLTLDYLLNLTHKVNEQSIQITDLEKQISNLTKI